MGPTVSQVPGEGDSRSRSDVWGLGGGGGVATNFTIVPFITGFAWVRVGDRVRQHRWWQGG